MAALGGGGLPGLGGAGLGGLGGAPGGGVAAPPQGAAAPGEGGLSGAILNRLNRQMMTQSQDPTIFTEACVVRAVGSGAVGGLMGAAMGLVLGGYGSIAPPVSMPGVPDPPKVPMKWQLRDSWYSTARRMRRWGKNFGSVTIVFSGVECCIEKYRAQHDIYNGVSAGCITGAVLAAGQGPAGMCIGCAGFAAFSAAVESIMGH